MSKLGYENKTRAPARELLGCTYKKNKKRPEADERLLLRDIFLATSRLNGSTEFGICQD